MIKIGDSAFFGCSRLASVIIPASVTNIGNSVFALRGNLTRAFFEGNAPACSDTYVFYGASQTTVCHLSSTAG